MLTSFLSLQIQYNPSPPVGFGIKADCPVRKSRCATRTWDEGVKPPDAVLEMVTAPVAADTVTFDPAMMLVTPVLLMVVFPDTVFAEMPAPPAVTAVMPVFEIATVVPTPGMTLIPPPAVRFVPIVGFVAVPPTTQPTAAATLRTPVLATLRELGGPPGVILTPEPATRFAATMGDVPPPPVTVMPDPALTDVTVFPPVL